MRGVPATTKSASVLTVLNLKGGVGKTHATWLLASVAEELGLRILLIDTRGRKVDRVGIAGAVVVLSNRSSVLTEGGQGHVFFVDAAHFVRVGDMTKSGSGRISQLFHQMIERHGQNAAVGRPLMPAQEFFASVTDDYSIAPNLEPHPSLSAFHNALRGLEQSCDGTRVFMGLADEDGSLVATAIVIVSASPKEHFQHVADTFCADGVSTADERTIRRIGPVPKGFNVWHVAWD